MLRVGLFNDLVNSGLFYFMTRDGATCAMLGLVGKAAALRVVYRIASREAEAAWGKFQTRWLVPFGIAQILAVDRDGASQCVFLDTCRAMGACVRCVPPGAHRQLGLAESGKGAARRVFETPAAHFAAFGRVPTLPAELLADATSAKYFRNVTQDQMLARGERCRIEAANATADREAGEALRAPLLRRPVNCKECDFVAGQR
ncbi:unnamed protein product, partial [Prorocentrum cordatum]